MKTIFKAILSICILLILALTTVINTRLYHSPKFEVIDGDTVNTEILAQLRGLRESAEKGADLKMQEIFPEGYMFFNVLYGLSWCELIVNVDKQSGLYREGFEELDRLSKNVMSKNGYAVFDTSLPLKFGAFYKGWSTYFLGKKLSVTSSSHRKQYEIELFQDNCVQIAEALEEQIYPESYQGNSWPADVMLCVSALALHDRLFEKKYSQVIEQWLEGVKKNLDENGLIPHSVKPFTGKPLESARGSSQSLMLCLLVDIDPVFASSQFKLYDSLFYDEVLGLSCVREYAKGEEGSGDIDSGPVLFGAGGAATIVGMKTMGANGSSIKSWALKNTVEALCFPYHNSGRKKYLLGTLPIVDAFVTWSQSKNLKAEEHRHRTYLKFHCFSIVLALILVSVLIFLWRKSLHRFGLLLPKKV